MQSIHRHGLFSQVLLMLGVVGLPPPPTQRASKKARTAAKKRMVKPPSRKQAALLDYFEGVAAGPGQFRRARRHAKAGVLFQHG